jgi:large subunit ribosomal protein L7Ae
VAAAPLAVKKMEQKRVVNPLFEKRARNFGIGQVHRITFKLPF